MYYTQGRLHGEVVLTLFGFGKKINNFVLYKI